MAANIDSTINNIYNLKYANHSNLNSNITSTINNAVNISNSNNTNTTTNYNRIGSYDIMSTIGYGNFGVCRLAQHRLTRKLVAIKFIDKTSLNTAHLERLYKEIDIMKCVNHENIIKLYQVMESRNMLYLVCEYATNGELFEYILRNGAMNEKMACEKFYQIVKAVDYCHEKNIVHRDLKTENLLLDNNMNIKLADFGFANYYNMINPLKTFCGSAPYAAPEVFCGQQYFGPEIDIWSLGVILYALVTGTLPFNSDNLQQLKQRVVACKYLKPAYLSSECMNLIENILVVNVNERYTLEKIKRHAWFRMNNIYFDDDLTIKQSKVVNNFEKSISESDNYDLNALNVMKSYGFDMNATLNSLKQNLFDNYTATYYFIKENQSKFNINLTSDKLRQLSCNTVGNNYAINNNNNNQISSINNVNTNTNNELNDLNLNLVKRKDLFKTLKKARFNKIHKNLISNSSSIDEGVESDYSSPTQSNSFSSDILSSVTSFNSITSSASIMVSPSTVTTITNTSAAPTPLQLKLPSASQSHVISSTIQSTTLTPPLTPPMIQTRKVMNQSQKSLTSLSNRNNSNSSIKAFNLSQIQRELKKLMQVTSNNADESTKIVNNETKSEEKSSNILTELKSTTTESETFKKTVSSETTTGSKKQNFLLKNFNFFKQLSKSSNSLCAQKHTTNENIRKFSLN